MRTEYTAVRSETAEGVLRELGRYAVEREYASEGYVEAVLDREADFPTGLAVPTSDVDVAIPHAEPDHVDESAVVLGLPDDAIRFRHMDDPEDTVDANVVMLLLAEDSEGYTEFLSNLANLFGDPSFAEAVHEDQPDRLLDLIEKECL